MAENTKISWATHTFNPWIGCQKISPGCENCYAEAFMDHRMGKVEWGPLGERITTQEKGPWADVKRWNRQAADGPERPTVFTASLSDVLEERPELYAPRAELLSVIMECANLDFLLLTKRPENARSLWNQAFADLIGNKPAVDVITEWRRYFPNAYWGISAEDHKWFCHRARELLTIHRECGGGPGCIFISAEPLLGPIDFDDDGLLERLRDLFGQVWVVTGGESGRNARPCQIEWLDEIVSTCGRLGVPVHVKQLGTRPFYRDQIWEGAIPNTKHDRPELWPDRLRVMDPFPGAPDDYYLETIPCIRCGQDVRSAFAEGYAICHKCATKEIRKNG